MRLAFTVYEKPFFEDLFLDRCLGGSKTHLIINNLLI